MKYNLLILRRKMGEDKSYWQSFDYETEDRSQTAATALTALNEREELADSDGAKALPIKWECNCLQRKCGACAMVINKRPMLACDARLYELGEHITIEPLKKFPVVEDLVVDRSVMLDNLKTIHLWFENSASEFAKGEETAYEASRCLQCGCCLEVCPNFIAEGKFFGMAAAVPATRIIKGLSKKQIKEISRLYEKHVYEGCGKSLACRNVCPAGIDIEKMLVNSNAAAVWKSFFGA